MQVPEQDETYEEDSFVVNGSEVEEDFGSASDEEEEARLEMVPEDSYVDGRRQYATRRRVHLRQTRTAGETRSLQSRKAKRSRIVRVKDSSEEEDDKDENQRKMLHTEKASDLDGSAGTGFTTSSLSGGVKSRQETVQHKQERFNNQALLSEQLDFQEPLSTSCVKTQVRVLEGTFFDSFGKMKNLSSDTSLVCTVPFLLL